MNDIPPMRLNPRPRHILAIVLFGALTLCAFVVLFGRAGAEENCPTPPGRAEASCDGNKAVIAWEYTNQREIALLIQARTSYGDGPEVVLKPGKTATGVIATDKASIPAGQVEFYSTVYDHQSGFWLEYADYEAVTCQTTAVTLRSFTAVRLSDLLGNLGGCAAANKLRGLACVVTDFDPGFVAGTCDAGYWFRDVRTARTFTLEQTVTVQGCIGEGNRLHSAPGWPLRISR